MAGHSSNAAIRWLSQNSPAPLAEDGDPLCRECKILPFPDSPAPMRISICFKSVATQIMIFVCGVFAGYFWAMNAFGLWPIVPR